MQKGGKLVQALENSGLCSRQSAGNCCKAALQSTGYLNGAGECRAIKMVKSGNKIKLQITYYLDPRATGLNLDAGKDFSMQNLH